MLRYEISHISHAQEMRLITRTYMPDMSPGCFSITPNLDHESTVITRCSFHSSNLAVICDG